MAAVSRVNIFLTRRFPGWRLAKKLARRDIVKAHYS